jgi:hypothetical protein
VCGCDDDAVEARHHQLKKKVRKAFKNSNTRVKNYLPNEMHRRHNSTRPDGAPSALHYKPFFLLNKT